MLEMRIMKEDEKYFLIRTENDGDMELKQLPHVFAEDIFGTYFYNHAYYSDVKQECENLVKEIAPEFDSTGKVQIPDEYEHMIPNNLIGKTIRYVREGDKPHYRVV